MTISRRRAMGLLGAGGVLTGMGTLAASGARAASADGSTMDSHEVYDRPGLEWVMNIVPICTAPELMGPENNNAADGTRGNIWPIVGGWFEGRGIAGTVVPGGGDFPVTRPDGVTIIDALYRLKTDDDYQIIIHNKGYAYPNGAYRLTPTFNVTGGKYAWLRESIFIANLVAPVPEAVKRPLEEGQNDRLIEVFRVT